MRTKTVRIGWLMLALAIVVDGPGAAAYAATHGGTQLAYLDPGTGSMVLQALVAAVAGIAITVNVYWKKITSFFGFSSDGRQDVGSEDDDLPND